MEKPVWKNFEITAITAAARRIIVIAVMAVFSTIIGFFCFACGGSVPGKIEGVAVSGATVEYDGKPHGIVVTGTQPGDEELYSADGETWVSSVMYTELGDYKIYCKIKRAGCEDFVSYATLTIKHSRLDLSADDIVCIYDGEPHAAAIELARPGDRCEFSYNGGETTSDIAFTDIGEYEISYILERLGEGYADGKFFIRILPDISGKYVGAEGIVEIDGFKMTLGGEDAVIEYGADGNGRVKGEDIAFSVKDGALTLAGKTYTRLAAGDTVFCVKAGNIARYHVSDKPTVKIEIKFDDGAAVFADGRELFKVSGVNYCESVYGVEPNRKLLRSDVDFTTEKTDIVIGFSEREARTPDPVSVTALYDGTDRAATVSGVAQYIVGEQIQSVPPACAMTGIYTYKAVVLSDIYLPAVVDCRVEVLPDHTGTYFCASAGVIVINGLNAEVNGEAAEYSPDVFGGGKINGSAFVLDGGVISCGCAEYVKTDKKLLCIRAGGVVNVIERGENTAEMYIFVGADAEGMTVSIANAITSDVLWTAELGFTALDVKIAGRAADYLSPSAPDEPAYMITEFDIAASNVAWVEFAQKRDG